jgi:predicted membrane-bound mannosyltransferase
MAEGSSSGREASSRDELRPAIIQGAAFVMIAAFAALLRFWHLGVRTFHPDESMYSLIAAQFSRGASYEHLPVTHGPLHYVGTAAIFAVFGDSDFTARALPAIFGVALAVLPFAFARHIGRVGAIAAALLLAVSPSLVYYSRFAGPEVYLAFFSAALAMVIWRYLSGPHRAWLYLMSALLAFMFVSTEMALVVTPIFVAYMAYLTGCDLVGQMSVGAEAPTAQPTHYDVLGVGVDASDKAIRGAYRKLIDEAGSRAARETLAHAHGVLTNPNRRAAYDRTLARQRARRAPDVQPGIGASAAVFAAAPIIAALWPVIGGLRARLNLHRLPVAAGPMLVLTLLAAPFYGPLVQLLPFVGDRGFEGQQVVYVIGGTNYEPGGELPIMLGTLGAIASIAGVIGWMWRWNAWVICWATFYGITVTMFTGFFTHQGGIWTGYWGTLDFWTRPEAEVTMRAPYYYGMLLALYDFLPAIAIAIGVAALVARGALRDRAVIAGGAIAIAVVVAMPGWTPVLAHHRAASALVVAAAAVLVVRMPALTKFLAFWAVASFFAFSAVPAKEPWLMVHITTPVALLAAKLVNDAVVAVPVPRLSMPSVRVMVGPRLVQAALAASFAGIAVFTLQASVLASWGHGSVPQLRNALALRDDGDTPIELIQPNQSAPDVREVRDAIARAGIETGLGTSMPVAVDSSYAFASTWLWYLRDYDHLTLADMRRGFDVPGDTVVLVDGRNRGKLTGAELALSVTYTQRWAFPHRFDDASTGEIASELVSAARWADWVRYATDRSSIGQLETVGGVAYFPRDLVTVLPPNRASDVLSTGVAPENEPGH